MRRRTFLMTLLAMPLAAPLVARGQKSIKVGFPMILSGPGALYGEPALKGARMFVEEGNEKGGGAGPPVRAAAARHQGERR
jgi:ABC-type branched-subunit amino acid transport system substrate-binding protein